MLRYELMPMFDNAKSFYQKAIVEEENGINTLYSYGTKVAYIKYGLPVVTDTYSNTTLRHIKEFLLQGGFKAESKKQILADYNKKHIKDIAKYLNDVLNIYDPYAEETNLQELEDHLKGGDIEGYIESLEEFRNDLESENEQAIDDISISLEAKDKILNYNDNMLNDIEMVIAELKNI